MFCCFVLLVGVWRFCEWLVRVVADADVSWDVVEVDEAVRREKDPMGGRGRNGCIGEMLEGAGKNGEEVLQSAV